MPADEDGRLDDAIPAQRPDDGPHSAEKVNDAAAGLYELCRYFNNATQPGPADATLPNANTANRVLGGVGSALWAMDQLLTHASHALAPRAGRRGSLRRCGAE